MSVPSRARHIAERLKDPVPFRVRAKVGHLVNTLRGIFATIERSNMCLIRCGFAAILVLVPVAFSALPNQKATAPTTMTRMVVRLMAPGVKANSFPALPKTIYRAGAQYARIEDAPDSRQQVQKLTVIAEPDAYSANLIDKKGTHVVQQIGLADVHLPIVLPFDPKHEFPVLDKLEFGDEYEFFVNAEATAEPGPTINAKPTDALRVKASTGSALLVLRGGTHTPVTLSWRMKDGEYKYEYIEYSDISFNPGLFTKPAGIQFKEVGPDLVGEH